MESVSDITIALKMTLPDEEANYKALLRQRFFSAPGPCIPIGSEYRLEFLSATTRKLQKW
jgi:hypothetical protein